MLMYIYSFLGFFFLQTLCETAESRREKQEVSQKKLKKNPANIHSK